MIKPKFFQDLQKQIMNFKMEKLSKKKYVELPKITNQLQMVHQLFIPTEMMVYYRHTTYGLTGGRLHNKQWMPSTKQTWPNPKTTARLTKKTRKPSIPRI